MRKGKYIDIYVIMVCMSHKKPISNLQQVDELLEKAYTDFEDVEDASTLTEEHWLPEENIIG